MSLTLSVDTEQRVDVLLLDLWLELLTGFSKIYNQLKHLFVCGWTAASPTWATLVTWTPSCSLCLACRPSPATCWGKASLGRRCPSTHCSGTAVWSYVCVGSGLAVMLRSSLEALTLFPLPADGLLTSWPRKMSAARRPRRIFWEKWRAPFPPQPSASLETCKM